MGSTVVEAQSSSGSGAHWDDPGTQDDAIQYDEAGSSWRHDETLDRDPETNTGGVEDDNEDDESRDLTHEEIWDDSVLIDAWNAANEEYEALHGKKKSWKRDRVHKSPL